MKRASFILWVLGLAILMTTCQPGATSRSETDTNAVINQVKGTWYGNLPCADCASISYRLTLHEGMTYTSGSIYNGKSNEEMAQEGRWEVLNDSTIQAGEGEDSQQLYRIDDGKLTMLDQQGQPIESDLAPRYELGRQPMATNNAARIQADMEKLQQGIDFRAYGNEPSWSLEIDFDKVIQFKSLNHPQQFSAPVPEPAYAQDAPGERYRAVTEAGELIVTILRDSCIDGMSGDQFPYKVSVDAKLTTDADYSHFEGCGRYLTDYRLHNIWVVEEMQGETLQTEAFSKGLPTLEFKPGEGQVYGHDGCNQFFGKVENQGNQLKFGLLGATRMACPNMEKSNQFTQLISDQTLTYTFEPRQLVLKQEEKVVLRLKNVD